jgi:EmrB/QacA subfamily drug resistance transporter
MAIPIIPLVVATAIFMENTDSTILATALPTIAGDLGLDPISLKLAVTSYLVSLAVFIPASGWVADRMGARTTFRIALAVFMAASIGCAFSGSLGQFVFWRAVQGAGGAMMVPVGRMVVIRTVSKNELVRALSFIAMPALIGPMLGPPLGGFIVTYADWRWIFFVNIPIGMLGIVLATLFIPDMKHETPPLDVRGFLLSAVGLGGLILGTAMTGRRIAPPEVVVACMVVGAISLAGYVYHAFHVPRPLLDLRLLRFKTFEAGILGGTFFRFGVGASAFLLPLMLQLGFGLDALSSGLITFAGAIGALAVKPLARTFLHKFGFRRLLIVNGLLASVVLMAYALFTAATPHVLIMFVLVCGGFLRSLQFTSLSAITYAELESSQIGAGTGMASVGQQVSVSLGVATGAMVLEMSELLSGRAHPVTADFAAAFVVVGLVSTVSALLMFRLPMAAGDEICGRSVPEADPSPSPSPPGPRCDPARN